MTSIDKAAIFWSVAIVAIAVGLAIMGNNLDTSPDRSYEEKTSDNAIDDNDSISEQSSAEPVSIFLQTDRDTYVRGDKIQISGSVNPKSSDTPISMIVFAPDGDIVTISQVTVDENRDFTEAIPVDGPLWEQEGKYLVRVHYGGEQNTAEVFFDFVDPPLISDTEDAFTINHEGRTHLINYEITNAKVQDMTIDPHCICLIVKVESQDHGMLTINLPRNVIDAKIRDNDDDDIFFVLMDGIEIPYDEVAGDAQSRKIQIKFEKETSELEIIGTEINMQSVKPLDEPGCIDMKRHVMDSDGKIIKCKLDIPSPAETKPLWKEYCEIPGKIGLQDDPIPIQIIKEYLISTDAFHQLEGIEDSITVKLPYGGIAVCPWFGGSQGTFDTVDDKQFSFVISFGATTKEFSYWVYQN